MTEPTSIQVVHLPRPLDPEAALGELNKLADTLKGAMACTAHSVAAFNLFRDELLEVSKLIRTRLENPTLRATRP